jgi:hypothetical protein
MHYAVGNLLQPGPPEIWDCDDRLDVVDRLLTEWAAGKRDLHGTVMFAFQNGADTVSIVTMAEEEEREIKETIAFFIVSLLSQKPWLIDSWLDMVMESVLVVEMPGQLAPIAEEEAEEAEEDPTPLSSS